MTTTQPTLEQLLAPIRERVEVANLWGAHDEATGTHDDLKVFIDSLDAMTALAKTDMPRILAALDAVVAEVIGEDTEEWVRRAKGSRMVSGASIIQAAQSALEGRV